MHLSFKRSAIGYFCSFVLAMLCSVLSMGVAHAQDATSNITVSITSPIPLPSSIALNDTVYVGLSASLDSPPKSTDECTSGSPRGWQGTTYGWSGGTFVDSNGDPTTPTGSTARLKLQFSSTGNQSVTVKVTSTTTSSCGTLNGSGSKTISVQVVGLKANSIQGSPGSLSNSTLYVAQGTKVTLTVTADGGSLPDGKPVWGGAASGTGSSTTVTFNTVSSSVSTPFTVTATCGNTVSLNVVVYNLSIGPPSGQNVLVGQIVNLSASIAPADLKLSNYQWSIPGTTVHDWTHSTSSSFVWPVTSDMMSSPNLSFAWDDKGGSRQVSLSAQANGVSVSGTSTFNVTSPGYTFSITPGGPVQVVSDPLHGNIWELTCGVNWKTLGDVGIKISATNVPTSEDVNSVALWQQVLSDTDQAHNTPTAANQTGWQHLAFTDPSTGQPKPVSGPDILDAGDPYPYKVDFVPFTWTDTPVQGLFADTGGDQVNRSMSFSDTLMYRPSASTWTEHTQSIWVPQAESGWGFSGNAKRQGAQWAPSDLTSSTNPKPSTVVSSPGYPCGTAGWSWEWTQAKFFNGQ